MSERLLVVRPVLVSRVNNHTPFARGRVQGPEDRRRRDEAGEKLYRLWKNSVEARRQVGVNASPFAIKDWMR